MPSTKPTLVAATKSRSGILKPAKLDELAERQRQRHERPGDGGGARAAVRLEHVAIQHHGAVSQRGGVDNGAQGTSYQALDLDGAALLLAARRLALDAVAGGRG